MALEIGGGGGGVGVHGGQLALDEVTLHRLAQADRHVRLAHGEIELLVGEDQLDADVGIELEELAEARRQPKAAEADGGGDLELAVWLVAAVGKERPR